MVLVLVLLRRPYGYPGRLVCSLVGRGVGVLRRFVGLLFRRLGGRVAVIVRLVCRRR